MRPLTRLSEVPVEKEMWDSVELHRNRVPITLYVRLAVVLFRPPKNFTGKVCHAHISSQPLDGQFQEINVPGMGAAALNTLIETMSGTMNSSAE